MLEAFLIDIAQGQIEAGQSRAALVIRVLESLLKNSGIQPQRVQEIHWVESGANMVEPGLIAQVKEQGFSGNLAAFQWPAVPLLGHYILQSVVRAIEGGERDLVIICQFGRAGHLNQDSLTALLLASPHAIGRHNLAPRARFFRRLSLNLRDGNAQRALSALKAPEPVDDEEVQEETPEELTIRWLAASRPLENISPEEAFTGAQWLDLKTPNLTGDLFLLSALLDQLESDQDSWGLLLSEGPQSVGLATLLQRI